MVSGRRQRQGSRAACSRNRAAMRGKHKPEFTPHVDTGDFVVVVNAGKLRVTGNKGEAKIYYRHSTYPAASMRLHRQDAGAVPDSRIGDRCQRNVAQGAARLRNAQEAESLRGWRAPHAAQQPRALEINA